jgi:iron complex transport system ATP-binding protein
MILLETRGLTLLLPEKTQNNALDLKIQAGEQWGILGSNGCGKTTLLHTLAGLRAARQGAVWLQGSPLTAFSPQQAAQSRALLFQDTQFLFAQTVWDYCLGARYPYRQSFRRESESDKAIVTNALSAMSLLDLAKRNVMQLSGGEKRRLALAAVLAQTPSVYLLDEPVNHLDIQRQIQVLTHFQQLTRTTNIATLITLHDMNLAKQFCTHILLIYPDGCMEHGTSDSLLTTDRLSHLYQCNIQHADLLFWPSL